MLLVHYNKNKETEASIQLVNKLLKLHQQHDYLNFVSYTAIADAYLNRGELTKARVALTKARKFARDKAPGEQEYLYNTMAAKIELADQNPLKALGYCQLSMKILYHKYEDTELFVKPDYENITDREKIIHIIPIKIKVLEALYTQNYPKATPELLLETTELAIAGVEYKNNQFRTKSAQRYWLNNRAVPLFEKAIRVALSIYERTGNQTYLNEAFQLSEQSKSMILRSILQDATAETFGGIPDSLIQKEQWLQRQMNHAN